MSINTLTDLIRKYDGTTWVDVRKCSETGELLIPIQAQKWDAINHADAQVPRIQRLWDLARSMRENPGNVKWLAQAVIQLEVIARGIDAPEERTLCHTAFECDLLNLQYHYYSMNADWCAKLIEAWVQSEVMDALDLVVYERKTYKLGVEDTRLQAEPENWPK